ncbi:PfkB family carbohydrate kinase [Leptolyngbya sp. AN02str]|uniref:PfkB family carbohydrate kinase n=1 Tax=Leptolyngbya sp. AN02str TaxID=3423363 RepID=UPI003D3131AD
MTGCGLFVGLVTLDMLYLVERVPASNEKIVAMESAIAVGGPATNAAIAFSQLGAATETHGYRTQVVGRLGNHPLGQLIRAELEQYSVAMLDLAAERPEPPPVSSILVTRETGDRAVVSRNAVKAQATVADIPTEVWEAIAHHAVDVVLLDGHQMAVSRAIAQQTKAQRIPVVVDGGSWKAGFEEVLPYVDYAICSANFHPPGCTTPSEVIGYLSGLGIPHIAITHGAHPIRYQTPHREGSIPVPVVHAVNTLGAGDIFHGAFCHFLLQHGFVVALEQAAQVAAEFCTDFGPRLQTSR